MIERHGELFLSRVFTQHEIHYCQGRRRAVEHFAGRWAAKEAILKCLGTGWKRGLDWTDIEVRHDPAGKPQVHLGGPTREVARALRVRDILLSIAHCRAYATAYALAVSEPRPAQAAQKPN
jgi:holo-[acyl-carrier protein] synthase